MTQIKVGFFHLNDENWAGGTYYLDSLIRMSQYVKFASVEIYLLADFAENRSILTVIKNFEFKIKKYLIFRNTKNKFQVLFNKVMFNIILKDVKFYLFNGHRIHTLIKPCNKFFWLGDLQNKVLPNFFDTKTLTKRNEFQSFILNSAERVVATSNTMKAEAEYYFPNLSANLKVASFVSFINRFTNTPEIDTLEYSSFFYVPNQFWAHKNHILILQAVYEIKLNRNKSITVIFTGKEYDFRFPKYTEDLKTYVKEHGLENEVKFLGFVSREFQISLFKNAICIIQPSCYEGWSTVVEDSKCLGKEIVVSDIPIHREQLGNKGEYFEPNDYMQLADLMENKLIVHEQTGLINTVDYRYKEQITETSESFYSIF